MLIFLQNRSFSAALRVVLASAGLGILPLQAVLAHSVELALGDGKFSTQAPKVGYVYSCQTFTSVKSTYTPWVIGAYWYPLLKDIYGTVSGEVDWPAAKVKLAIVGDYRTITGNGLPYHPTGVFPIAKSDPVYQYDKNPNSIKSQSLVKSLKKNPQVATKATCLNMGAIGYTLHGVAIYNALDVDGRDAPAHEVQDALGGHPQKTGEYHYHNYTPAMQLETPEVKGKHGALLGYARDGFGIYGPTGADGKTMTNAKLDSCHGHSESILWDGKQVSMYHYHVTEEYPYTLGCYKGTPAK